VRADGEQDVHQLLGREVGRQLVPRLVTDPGVSFDPWSRGMGAMRVGW
jgi:hypothetical protein